MVLSPIHDIDVLQTRIPSFQKPVEKIARTFLLPLPLKYLVDIFQPMICNMSKSSIR